ncbi:MAG: SGNH/GDSL hydrolase family protein, partial [Candidatus Rokuibacteriota bacterium]
MGTRDRHWLGRGLVFNRIALVAWSLLFCFVVAEAALRIVGRLQGVDYRLYAENLLGPVRYPLGLYCRFRSYTYGSLCPNFAGVSSTSDFTVVYQTNSKGLRDQEYPAQKPAGRTRILAIGDSFTFGHGIAYGDRYTDLLESAFDDLEVITMAVPGSGHDQQLMQFVHEGLSYRPDHLFVFVTAATLDPMRYFPPLVREGKVELPAFDRFVVLQFPTLDDRVAKAAASWPVWRKSHALSLLAFKVSRAALQMRFRQQDEEYWGSLIKLPPKWGTSALPPSLPASQVAR